MDSIWIKEKISKLLISERTNVVVISDNHLTSLVHTCLLFLLMQGLIVGNMLTGTLLWMHMQDVMLHSFFPFHINHIGQSQLSYSSSKSNTFTRERATQIIKDKT